MDEWIERLADALRERRLEPAEVRGVLNLARDVAHGVERKLAPLSAYLAGLYVGRETTEGTLPRDALQEALRAARSLIPEAAADGGASAEEAGERGRPSYARRRERPRRA